MRISRYSNSAAMLTIAVCAHADCAERASMVSIRTVVIVIPPFQETEIDGGQECENPDDCGACTVSRAETRTRCELSLWKSVLVNVVIGL